MQNIENKKSLDQKDMQSNKIPPSASNVSLRPALNQEGQKPLSVSLSEHLYVLLKEKAKERDVRSVVGIAKELREIMKLNFELLKWENR